jgi:ribosome-associated heat shock protein Hsp15
MDHKGCVLRLDKFLYFVRLAKSRAKSVSLIHAGRMRIDGRPVTSIHTDIRIGQTITMAMGSQVRAIRVLAIPTRRGPASEALACYADMITPEPIDVSHR